MAATDEVITKRLTPAALAARKARSAPSRAGTISSLASLGTPMGKGEATCALLGLDAESLNRDRTALGQLLETFVFQDLRRQADWREDDIRFVHFRDKDGAEVDIVLERGAGQVAGVEVKASATVTATDFRGLRQLREAAGARFAAGVVLYDGEVSAGFGDGLYAVPLRALWEPA